METFEFTTPDLATRDPQAITVDLVGQQLELSRPKDWVLSNVATIMADDVPNDRRAQAILRYLLGALGEDNYAAFLSRTLDRADPINLRAILDFIVQSWNRWNDYNPRNNPLITIGATNPGHEPEPIRLVNRDLNLDVAARPPKDLVIMIVAACATRSTSSGHRWAIEYFLEACVEDTDFIHLNQRLNSANDPIDIEHLDPIISELIDKWSHHIDIATPEFPTTDQEHGAHWQGSSTSATGDLDTSNEPTKRTHPVTRSGLGAPNDTGTQTRAGIPRQR